MMSSGDVDGGLLQNPALFLLLYRSILFVYLMHWMLLIGTFIDEEYLYVHFDLSLDFLYL